MISPTVSQTISRGEVKEIINNEGDTLVLMNLEDAKIVLGDLLEYEIADSIITIYKEKDTLNTNTISLQKDIIVKLTQKSDNQQSIIDNFEQILSNKDKEIELKDKVIETQGKEIKKQKRLKVVGFIGSIVLPILTLIALI
jgi:nitric oxide reductase large subunit|tara:strand:+ start:81 stop:503 length:423 start_codon:yes stop_codon:yes gene_type:complete